MKSGNSYPLMLKSLAFEQELNTDTLFRNLIRLATIACILTLLVEVFVPLGRTYLYTLLVLFVCLTSLLLHAYGWRLSAYHFFLISISIGFTIIALLIDKVYPSTLNLYSLGIILVIAFIPSNRYGLLYLGHFTVLHLFLSYYILATKYSENLLYEYLYDVIHIVAYNVSVFIVALYFIKFVEKQREEINLLKEEKNFSDSKKMNLDLSKLSKFDSLSAREKEVSLLIGDGLTNKQVAEHLYISIETVKTHRKNIKSKLEIKSNKDFFLFTLYQKN